MLLSNGYGHKSSMEYDFLVPETCKFVNCCFSLSNSWVRVLTGVLAVFATMSK